MMYVTRQVLVSGTWARGRNEAFLSRAVKFAQKQNWPALLHAFKVAIAKARAFLYPCFIPSIPIPWS